MLIIGIAGGSGSGKTTVVKKIMESLPADTVSLISQDAYYKDNGHLPEEEKKKINFDHPSSIEWDLLIKHLDKLKGNQSIQMPMYSYVTCARAEETLEVYPRKVIIVEGILILTNRALRERFDIKVYVDADSDDRLMRIISRDIKERGRNYQQVLDHYAIFVKPMHEQFIDSTKKYADIIVPMGGKNKVAIDILSSRIRMILHH
ncbi:MAG: uridine kinase [Bacteroidales bacterium]|nr:uridine kinase [Bacteroidales bacterium]MCF8387599.1 uridine kinase [Bacteroidales bacterium]MCF8397595.1 uridine kinase [Bacteroidales bacterium]